MKTEPTALDREAAQFFSPAGGMRAAWRRERNGVRPAWERLRDGSEATPDFYDTDDPATVGCMLAQVEQAANHTLSEVADNGDDHRRPERRHAVMVWSARGGCERHEAAHGPTRGAALVAAMRQIRRGVTP
jgi:hypothetical protein